MSAKVTPHPKIKKRLEKFLILKNFYAFTWLATVTLSPFSDLKQNIIILNEYKSLFKFTQYLCTNS